MAGEEKIRKKSIIAEVKQKIRLLNGIAVFIVLTLLAIILRYLYKPFGDVMDFLPDVSVTVIILIVVALSLIGFYIWRLVTKRILGSIEKYKNRLDSILVITKDLREEVYGDILLGKIMDYSLSLTRSDSGSIFLIEDDQLVFKVVKGEKSAQLSGSKIPKGKSIAGLVADKGLALRIADIKKDERFDQEVDAVTGYRTGSLLCVPLTMKTGIIIGGIELFNKKEGFYSERDEEIIAYLADQAAISLARAQFYEDQRNYEMHVTDILLESIDSHVPEKIGHSKRVARYSNVIAKAINMSEEERKKLYLACILHDVGFLKIKAEDNFKRQYFIQHPVIGYEMISPINFYADIAPFILYHHERYDGLGYPEQRKGEDIPLGARIIAITEAFDAMVSESSYKVPLGFDAALDELKRNAGTQFDFWLVDEFVNNITPEHLE
jgi:putative methionine-R-sulfoxide reductase with GAF domain